MTSGDLLSLASEYIVIALSFVELSKVFDCEKGIAKQLKILKVIGDRLRQRRSFVFAAILLIIRHSCQSFYVILLNLALR